LAIICFVDAAFQIMGFIGVAKESTILYRRYVTLHAIATIAAFSVSAVWIILSGTRHTAAQSKCERDFFPESDADNTSEGKVLCNIFSWVDVGIMAVLWIFLAATQLYFYIVLSSYGSAQRQDREKYDALGSPTERLTNDIPMNRADTWDSRESDESLRERDHTRQGSAASVSTIIGDKQHQPADYSSNQTQGSYDQNFYPQPQRQYTHHGTLSYPPNSYSQDPVPTSDYRDMYASGRADSLDKPTRSQARGT